MKILFLANDVCKIGASTTLFKTEVALSCLYDV